MIVTMEDSFRQVPWNAKPFYQKDRSARTSRCYEPARKEPARIEMASWRQCSLEARGGIEPPIKVLQTFALPLGDRASGTTILTDRNPGIAFLKQTAMPGLWA